jgi:FKBP-type peptidyl-prolyl cis-trans isomerase 2
MIQVKKGDTIKVHYKGTLSIDGSLFDSSEGRPPLAFTVGSGMVIAGFDNGVVGMQVGEKKLVQIPADEAYGQKLAQMVFEFERAQIPAEMGEPEIGMQLVMNDNDGNELPVIIIEIKENSIVLDGNHPLAGADLTFDIELVEIGSEIDA